MGGKGNREGARQRGTPWKPKAKATYGNLEGICKRIGGQENPPEARATKNMTSVETTQTKVMRPELKTNCLWCVSFGCLWLSEIWLALQASVTYMSYGSARLKLNNSQAWHGDHSDALFQALQGVRAKTGLATSAIFEMSKRRTGEGERAKAR